MNHALPAGLTREPNVVPMIDILLVLLIIFMMATAHQRLAFDLQLPQDAVGGEAAPPIVLEVRPGPVFALNGADVPSHELARQIATVYDGRPSKVLFVRGDPAVRYQDVISAMDVARGAGVRVTGVVLPRSGR